jgi:RNA polymerase sigma factor for flagellar operon FliA
MDPLPRSLRKSTREVEQASQELAANLGRWPTQREVAFRMGMPIEQLDGIAKHAGSKFVSLEHALQDRGGEAGPSLDPVDEDESSDPAKAADHNASLAMLDIALKHLAARDRAILQLRYAEAKPFHEIGQMMGLSESRVCQLHKRILAMLRRQMAAQLDEAA